MNRSFSRPSPALVLAMLALLMSLVGSAAAGRALITSRDIKDGTIRLVDLNGTTKHALTSQANVALGLDNAASPTPLRGSSIPQPRKLLPLGADGLFPESVLPLDSTTKAPNVAARVYASQSQTTQIQIAGAPLYQVRFDQVSFDTAHMFDPSHPTQLTIKTPGIYLLTTTIAWAENGPNGINRATYLGVNNHVIAVDQRPPAGETRQIVTTVYKLNAGDTVFVAIAQDSGLLTASAVGDVAPALAVAWLAPG